MEAHRKDALTGDSRRPGPHTAARGSRAQLHHFALRFIRLPNVVRDPRPKILYSPNQDSSNLNLKVMWSHATHGSKLKFQVSNFREMQCLSTPKRSKLQQPCGGSAASCCCRATAGLACSCAGSQLHGLQPCRLPARSVGAALGGRGGVHRICPFQAHARQRC